MNKINKRFGLFLKSHCLYPDFESVVEAKNKKDALKKIREKHGITLAEWDDKVLLENIGRVDFNGN